jgi:hypothetical protein
VSLVARRLEEAGIATVVVGSARDVVEEVGVPRFVYVDFPLGNPCGAPSDREMQRRIVSLALQVVETAIAPRTTVQSPEHWPDDSWRESFMEIGDHNREALRAAGERRRAHQAANQ